MAVSYVTVTEDQAGQRVDRWLRRLFPGLNQGLIERMCRRGELRVDGNRVKPSERIEPGQTVRVPPVRNPDRASEVPGIPGQRKERKLTKADARIARSLVIYRDDHLIAVNKPPGLPSQGGSGLSHHLDRLSAAMVPGNEDRPRLVHRLDSETSGVMLLSRSRLGAARLSEQFRTGRVRKIYWAIVTGLPRPEQGTIRFGLVKMKSKVGEGTESWQMRCVLPDDVKSTPGARRATSQYHAVDSVGEELSWLALRPITGRTHQLRAHLAEIGHPILGDRKYGRNGAGGNDRIEAAVSSKSVNSPGKGLHLHARSISFEHPRTGQSMQLVAQLPESLKKSWEWLGWTESMAPIDPFPSAADETAEPRGVRGSGMVPGG